MSKLNLVGEKFGNLMVVEEKGSDKFDKQILDEIKRRKMLCQVA